MFGPVGDGDQSDRLRDDEPEEQHRATRDYSAPFRIAGSRGSSVSLPDTREDGDSIRPVANLMMAAAHADGKFCADEQATVRGLLCQLIGKDVLPESLERLLAEFDPARFDLQAAVQDFRAHAFTSDERMLQLVRKVCDADATIDLREDNYMVGLALALSLAPHKYKRLVVRESRGVNGFWKRVEDVLLGGVALLLLSLPMLLIALFVKLTSRGPVFFRQRRYGQGGREIDVFKFRTMRVLENGVEVKQAQKHDPRITPVGRFLRRSSLDELPQLLNVVRGDMSLVGPRPHAVAHNEMYRQQIVEYMLRHKVKPGITGWAQVNGWRGETDTLRKMVYRVEHDLDYIRDWSLWLDAKILWLTVFGRKVRQNAY
jgi:putative colanic acid biosynthesis UDP-glucose lipid carrier transferase